MPELQTNNPFSNLKARSIFLCFFLISFALGLISVLISGFFNLNFTAPILTYIFYCLSFGLVCAWIIRRCYKLKINLKYLIGNLPNGYKWLPIVGFVIAVLLFSLGTGLLFLYFLSLFAPSFLEVLLKSMNTERAENSSPIFYLILNVFSVVIVAPITEEFIFRGILLHRWAAKWGVSSAILVSSIVFGLLHPYNPFGLSVFGIVMALLYIKNGTIIVPMVAHSLNNAFVTAVQFLPQDSSTSEIDKVSYWRSEPILISGIIFIAISAFFLIRFFYRTWPNKQVSLPYFANANQSNTHNL